jgi:hypothetical protein
MDNFIEDIIKAKNKYLVEIKRKHVFRGIVIDYSINLILLACVDDDFHLNGYILLKTEGITAYRIYNKPEYFLFKVQQELDLRPEYPFKLDLSDMKSACNTIHNFYPLITVYKEKSDAAVYIGIITKITEHTFSFYEIDSNAEWDKEHTFYFKKVPIITWGGGYENALWQVGRKHLPGECEKAVSDLLS